MRISTLLCSLFLFVGSAFAQDCETFSADLDAIKSSILEAPQEKLADANFQYTLDKRIISEADLRKLCKEGISIEQIIYRRVEGQPGKQPLIRLVSTAEAITDKQDPAIFLKWTFAKKASVPKGIYDHPYFHQEREEDGQPVFLFWIKSAATKKILQDIDPNQIEAINVKKDKLSLQQYDAEESAGIIEIMLKEETDYYAFLGLKK